jgi:hypothetical protein
MTNSPQVARLVNGGGRCDFKVAEPDHTFRAKTLTPRGNYRYWNRAGPVVGAARPSFESRHRLLEPDLGGLRAGEYSGSRKFSRHRSKISQPQRLGHVVLAAQPIIGPPVHSLRPGRKRFQHIPGASQSDPDSLCLVECWITVRLLLALIGQAGALSARKQLVGEVELCNPPPAVSSVGRDGALEPGALAAEVALRPRELHALLNVFPIARAEAADAPRGAGADPHLSPAPPLCTAMPACSQSVPLATRSPARRHNRSSYWMPLRCRRPEGAAHSSDRLSRRVPGCPRMPWHDLWHGRWRCAFVPTDMSARW